MRGWPNLFKKHDLRVFPHKQANMQYLTVEQYNNLIIEKAMKKLKEGSKVEQARDKKAGAKEMKNEKKEYGAKAKMKAAGIKVFGVNPFKKK